MFRLFVLILSFCLVGIFFFVLRDITLYGIRTEKTASVCFVVPDDLFSVEYNNKKIKEKEEQKFQILRKQNFVIFSSFHFSAVKFFFTHFSVE